MRLKKFAAGAAALVLSTALIAGCGDKDDSNGSGDSNSSSGGQAAGELTKDNFAEQIGTAMQEAGSVHVKMTSGSLLEAEGDQSMGESAADSTMSLTMTTQGITMDMILIDQKLYMNMGSVTRDKYAVVDLTDSSNPVTAQFGSLAEQTDISKQFETFKDALKKFEKADKSEKIDGVDTQAYDITVDAKKLAEAQGQDASIMPDTVTYRFFVGSDNLVRRMSLDLMGQNLTMDFTDWGKDVSIEKPKDSDISDVDLASLMGGAG